MTNEKCQLRLGQKVHGLVAMDKFKTTCPKWLKGFFYACQKWSFFTKISSKKIRYYSNVLFMLMSLFDSLAFFIWIKVFKNAMLLFLLLFVA
jgi:hypothetical protein